MAFKDTSFWKAITAAWKWTLLWTEFLNDKTGKFSFKRGVGVASFVTSVIFAFHGTWILALIYLAATVILGIICAVTGT